METAEAIISNDSPPPIIKTSSTLAVSTAKAIMFNTSPLPRLKHRWRWQPRRDDGQGPKVSSAASSTLGELRHDNKEFDSISLEKMLTFMCSECPDFAVLLRDALVADDNHLSLILYCDGVTPGSALGHDNKRKSVVWYASFAQFGLNLCHEELWMTLAVARTSALIMHPAMLSGFTRLLLRDLFMSQDVNGKGIHILGRHARVAFHALLADEEALSGMWYAKGASGITPCAICCTVTNKPTAADIAAGLRSLPERSPLIQDISCSDKSRIGIKTDSDVWQLADKLMAQAGAPTLQASEQNYGLSYHPDAILFDKELRRYVRPATCNRMDLMHVVYSNGVLSAEVMLFLRRLKDCHGFYFEEVRKYMANWRCPWIQKLKPADCFNDHRENSSKEFLKVGASELLGVYPALRHLVVEGLLGSEKMAKPIEALLALMEMCDHCRQAVRCRTRVRAVELATKMDEVLPRYFEAFKAAYGKEYMRFKHHQLLHLSDQVRADGFLMACWALERKHIGTKQSMEHFCQSEKMPWSGAMSRIINNQAIVCEFMGSWARGVNRRSRKRRL